MSITGVLIAALIVGGTGVFIGVFLGIAGKKFAVEVDEKEEAILAELPGNNCGGCGYAGCSVVSAMPSSISGSELSTAHWVVSSSCTSLEDPNTF